jgi:diguanylate cyclase (GGDEF)-like protein/PAS domain S-box-containing protein
MEDTWAERAGLNATFKEVLEGAADAIVAADTGGRIVLWNDAAEELFGYPRASMLGSTVSKLIPDRFLREYEKGVATAFKTGRPAVSHLTTVARAADGTEYPVEAAVSIAGTGSEAIAVGIVRRIGERFKKLALLRESERQLRDAEQLAGMGSFEWNVGSDEISWSDQLARIYGYEPDNHPKRLDEFLSHVHADDREGLQNNIRNALATGSAWSMDERVIRADGERRVLSSRVKALKNAQGEIERLVGICHDVTEQRRAEEELEASEARFRRIFDDAPIGMLLVDVTKGDAFITRTNRAVCSLLGYTNAELAQMRLSHVVDTPDWPLLRATLTRATLDRTSLPPQLEIRLRAKSGARPIALAAASGVGGEGTWSSLIVHLEDVSLRKHAEDQLRHRALHDPLTGLPNRDLLLDRLNGALSRARRAENFVGVLLLNLDNFKMFNDTRGHIAGDEILRSVANRLLAAGRAGDTVARVGGDEFVVVCENVAHDDELGTLARRVANVVATPMTIGGEEVITTASVGLALGRETDPEQLLRDADLAMYHAKQRGKNAVELFDETLRRQAMDSVDVKRDLRNALRNGEIEPYYQPIVEIATGAIGGFEALARWNHPVRGLLLPGEFLAIAEEAHLIGRLGTEMLRKACRQLAQWQARSPELSMAVNFSPLQLDTGVAGVVADVMQECSIEPRSLLIEITETVFLDMKKAAASHLNALARLGVQLGIDDFGTGYSSLLYLKRFPVRFLKIDRSFVNGLPGNQEDAAIVEAIVRLGRSLELATIAEGVETKEQFDALRSVGCTYAQGYYIAQPRPAAECALTA